MTKKEWQNLKIGHKVTFKTWTIDNNAQPPKPIDVILKGEVVRFNSNYSQALIKFESGSETWHGRLSIEIDKTQ